jgi:hypothetical protein
MMTMGARSLVAVVVAVGLEGSTHAALPKETVKLTISGPDYRSRSRLRTRLFLRFPTCFVAP